MALSKNSAGREYYNGVATSDDLRRLIIQETIALGGNVSNGEVPRGVFAKIGEKFKIDPKTVKNFWSRYLSSGSITATPRHRKGNPKLTEPDLQLIGFMKRDKPSVAAHEIKDTLKRFSPVSGNVSVSTINQALKRDLNFSFKRLSRPTGERFTDQNIRYTQAFIEYCQTKHPSQIKYMDESGFTLVDAGKTYGHSEKGKRCYEMVRYHPGANLTLNVLTGMDGILYFNFVNGPSNTDTYLQFWGEASISQDGFGRPIFMPGDLIVVDNCPFHHHQAERILYEYFDAMGVEYTFLPTYSPDLNPVERVFLTLKTLLKTSKFSEIAQNNLKLAISAAMNEVTQRDTRGFYRLTGYLNV